MDEVLFVLKQPVVKGAIAGALASARADYEAFKAFKSLEQFAAYDWRVCAWRVIQGAVIGAVSAAGITYGL